MGSSGFYAKRILRSSGLYERPQRLLNDSGFTNPRKRVLLWFIHRGDRLIAISGQQFKRNVARSMQDVSLSVCHDEAFDLLCVFTVLY